MGYHEISVMATPTNNHSISYQPPADEKSRFGGSSSYDRPPEYSSNEFPIVIACSYGKVLGIDSGTGESIWRFECPGGGYNLPSVLAEKDVVFVGAGRMVYALNPKNGGVYWETKATNGLIGSGYLTMATVWGSRQAEM
jgi:outer membrane protein assembly factor BamB